MLEEDLSRGEKLYIKRKRNWRPSRVVAAEYGVSSYIYQQWERDEKLGPDVKLGGLNPHEHFIVLRKRAGYGVQEMATKLGVRYDTFQEMERGNGRLTHLMEFWYGGA